MTEGVPPLSTALRVWLRIGLLSFGGPAGQIALMHREVVDQRNWVGERRFLQALNFCTLLPGPEAMQLATYLGWLMHGVRGGLIAGALFVLPGAALMLVLSLIYAMAGNVPLVASVFFGLKCAVLVLVIQALVRIGRRALHGPTAYALAALAFVALFVLGVPFPIVMIGAGLIGYAVPARFVASGHPTSAGDGAGLIDAVLAADPGRVEVLAHAARRAGVAALGLWLVPVAGLWVAGPGRFADIGWFFSKMAVVTIGGAYAVLAYVAQDAVTTYAWLSPADMLSGLGLAETTPGPLILVLQFVGFMAGFGAPGALSGLMGGVVGSVLTLWVTFVPCFAFVFLGAPLIERLQENRALSGALAAITAAVVGVIANLALWFSLRVLFARLVPFGWALALPDPSSLDPVGLGLSAIAAACLFAGRLGVPMTLAISAGMAILIRLLVGP